MQKTPDCGEAGREIGRAAILSHALALFLTASCAFASDPEPVGKMVDVGGRRLHIHCTGSGAPAIVLEASGGTGFYMWHAIQSALSKDFRVCSYDRAGTAFSDAHPTYDKSVAGRLEDLHELLRKAGEKPPFVMAGHSLGGFLAWKYAERHPGDVAGVVLLDSLVPGTPVTAARVKTADEARAKAEKQIEEWTRTRGWKEMYVPDALPADLKEKIRQLSKTEKWWRTRFSPLGKDYEEPFQPLNVPVTVVTATKPAEQLQFLDRLFASMKNVRHIRIDARHDFHEDQPQLVTEVIRDMALRVRE